MTVPVAFLFCREMPFELRGLKMYDVSVQHLSYFSVNCLLAGCLLASIFTIEIWQAAKARGA